MFCSMNMYRIMCFAVLIGAPVLVFGNESEEYIYEDEYAGLEDLKDIIVTIPLSEENRKETLTVTLDSLVNPLHQSRISKSQNEHKKARKISRERMETARFMFMILVALAIDQKIIKKFGNWRKIRITLGVANFFLSWFLSDWIFNYGDRATGATEYFINDMTENKINAGVDLYSRLLEAYSDVDNGILNKDDFKKLIEESFKNPFLNQLMQNLVADSGIYSVDSNLINQDIDFQSQYTTNLLLESYFIDKNFSQNRSVSSLVNTYPGIRYLPYASIPLHAYFKKRNLSFLIPPSLEALKPFPMLGQFGRETIALMALMYFPELMDEGGNLVPILSSIALSYATTKVALAGVSRLLKAYKVFRAASKGAAVGEVAAGPVGWKLFILNQLAVITGSMLLEGPVSEWYTKRKVWLALQDAKNVFYKLRESPMLDPWVVQAAVTTFYQLLYEYRRLALKDRFDKDNELLEEGRKEEIRIDIMEENMRRVRRFLADDLWKSKPYYELVEGGHKFDIFVETHTFSKDIGITMPVPIKKKHICIFHTIENTCSSQLPIAHPVECSEDPMFYDIVTNGLPQPDVHELISEFDREESAIQSNTISHKDISPPIPSAINEFIQSELALQDELRNSHSIKAGCRNSHHSIDSAFREPNAHSNHESKIDGNSLSKAILDAEDVRKSQQEEYTKAMTAAKRQYLVAALQAFEDEHRKKTIKASVAIKDAYYGLDVTRRDFIREHCKEIEIIDPQKIRIPDSPNPPLMAYSPPMISPSYYDTLLAGYAFATYVEKAFPEFDTQGNNWKWLVERETKHIERLNELCGKIPNV